LNGTIDAPKATTLFDADSQNAVSWITDTSSQFKNPSSIGGITSSKLELQLTYLAKELEVERMRRENLQKQV